MSPYTAVELIRAKRDGHRLTDAAIGWLIAAYTDGQIADEQMAAMAMAIYFRGMDDRELATWTRAMIATGSRMDFATLNRPTVDKHSTGGVGDKITLPLVPLVAACGAEPVPYPLRLTCCSGALIITNREAALSMVRNLLESAVRARATVIVTACPLCLYNLNKNRSAASAEIVYFTRLLAEALGLDISGEGENHHA